MVVIISTDKSGKPRDEVGRIWLEDSNDRISVYERGEKENNESKSWGIGKMREINIRS